MGLTLPKVGSYPLGEVSGLQSGYAVRLYELLTKSAKRR